MSETVFAGPGTGAFSGGWMPVVFAIPADGAEYCFVGMRAAPRVA
ncbi:hypothetical protein [Actinorugispora endophytica]|uniref:Uncharacterized protein n=1 Tax=Actinorugispora endophytica TaxID=1605990 RepID=A0A4R6V277_9ACTN|nr:hypothetical protein [Actinorugispora endophytica]TDQ54264.1 hypothetical protein EV190_10297 [Actinorugispora endophytica]